MNWNNTSKRPVERCTIVVPCYNEAARLPTGEFLEFAERNASCRFLFVNDGSTDRTREVLESLTRLAPGRFALHSLPRNRGKAEAVRQGVLEAARQRPEHIGYWDADLATPLESIPDFCDVLDRNQHVQMVLGSRVRLLGRVIRRRPLRHVLGRGFATAASIVLGMAVYDTQCGAKLFRATPDMAALFAQPFQSRWIFDVELLARLVVARRAAGSSPAETALYELPLSQWQDVSGSKVRPRHFIRALFELTAIAIRYRLARRWGSPLVYPIPQLDSAPAEERKAA